VGWRGCASTCASTRSVRVKVLVDELRRELAQRYLEQGVHRPKSIAALLGYKDLSAFHHAFRRWTGTTPAQFSQDPRVSCNFPGRT
jgi:AraC-like DNA-binding protein